MSRELSCTSAKEVSSPAPETVAVPPAPFGETDTIPIDSSLPAGIAAGLMVSFGSPPSAALPSIGCRFPLSPPGVPVQNSPNVTTAGTPAWARV